MLISIDNLNFPYHFEIIESVIIRYDYILKIHKNQNYVICLENINDEHYIKYINEKYPNILINKKKDKFNFKIYTTFYSKLLDEFNQEIKNKKYFFIAHEINEKLKKYKNVYFLTKLCNTNNNLKAFYLPFREKKIKSDIPIYIIQGNFTELRRNYKLLLKILEKEYKHDFKIKFIGRGNLPDYLEKYSSKFIIKNNLNFIDYHKEFLNGYVILPLILKKSHKKYYINKLTSSINYAIGYNLKCLIDQDLQNIYNLNNVEIFKDENDIQKIFEKTLNDFYKVEN